MPDDARHALLDIDELLGRDREEHHLARQVILYAGGAEADRGAEHAGDLRVVAAGVGGAGVRVGERMVGGAQRIELGDDGDARAAGLAGEAALDAGERKACGRVEA